ncbi:MAG: DUF5103 domain-containing protein, partial [Bacteroidales bacterium]|nr:DUF5103 domain-containing protein [Bacteroidales bacterium]
MRPKHILSILLLLPLALAAQFRTETLDGRFRTLQVYPVGQPGRAPVIQTQEQVQIAFDELSHDYHRLAYRVLHCDADWTRSSMNELEY